jgi:AraC family transcriptional regulator
MSSLELASDGRGATASSFYQTSTGAPSMDAARWRDSAPDVANFVRQAGFTSFLQRTPTDAPVHHDVEVFDPPEHVLMMFRRPVSRVDVTIDAQRRSYSLPPRSFVAIPMGMDSACRTQWREIDAIHHLHFEDRLFRLANPGETGFPCFVGLADARLAGLVEIAIGLTSESEPPSQLAWEACGILIINQLMRAAGQQSPAGLRRGGLAGWQVRRTTDFIHANLDKNIGLQDLATIAGLSAFHFARAFKQSVGDPPHRYQTRRRIERACELLAATDLPIIEVAAAVGYEAPQTLTRLFRREMGVTPSEYRRDARR